MNAFVKMELTVTDQDLQLVTHDFVQPGVEVVAMMVQLYVSNFCICQCDSNEYIVVFYSHLFLNLFLHLTYVFEN